jgi:hypothetical protein
MTDERIGDGKLSSLSPIRLSVIRLSGTACAAAFLATIHSHPTGDTREL